MERHLISQKQAFDAIRNKARSKRLKIDEIAEQLLTGIDSLNMWKDENKLELFIYVK